MNQGKLLTGVIIEEMDCKKLCQLYGIPKALLLEMIEEGLFSTPNPNLKQITLDEKAVHRIEAALRLHRDLKINLPGVVLALELLDEMESLERELSILRKHF